MAGNEGNNKGRGLMNVKQAGFEARKETASSQHPWMLSWSNRLAQSPLGQHGAWGVGLNDLL